MITTIYILGSNVTYDHDYIYFRSNITYDHACMYILDSIDTATTLQLMQSLVKLTNIYIGQTKQLEKTPNHSVLRGIAKYVTRMLKIFGANEGEQEIGFPAVGGSVDANVSFIKSS